VLQFAVDRRAAHDERARLELDSGTAVAAARQIVRAIRVRIEVMAAIARSELSREEKLPALRIGTQELVRDAARWVNQLLQRIGISAHLGRTVPLIQGSVRR